jgi:hypothetical protein
MRLLNHTDSYGYETKITDSLSVGFQGPAIRAAFPGFDKGSFNASEGAFRVQRALCFQLITDST